MYDSSSVFFQNEEEPLPPQTPVQDQPQRGFILVFNLLAYKPIESWSFPQIHVLTTYLSFLWLLLSPSPPNSCIMKTCASVCAPGALPLRSFLSTHNVLRACN